MMLDRRTLIGAMFAAGVLPATARAAPFDKVKASGHLSVAMYRDFEPWSWEKDGKLVGIDVEIATLIARDLGLSFDAKQFLADEAVDDDLRNIVWKGSKAGGGIADLMMHAPIDREFGLRNDQVAFFAPYTHESFAFAVDSRVVDPEADFLSFRDRNVAVEMDSVPDIFMLGSLGGRQRATVVHKPTGPAAVAALVAGEVPLVMATRAQVEHGLAGQNKAFAVRRGSIPGLFSTGWDVGIAVRDDSRDLGERVQTVLAAAVADQRIDAIFERYGVRRVAPKTAMPAVPKSNSGAAPQA